MTEIITLPLARSTKGVSSGIEPTVSAGRFRHGQTAGVIRFALDVCVIGIEALPGASTLPVVDFR